MKRLIVAFRNFAKAPVSWTANSRKFLHLLLLRFSFTLSFWRFFPHYLILWQYVYDILLGLLRKSVQRNEKKKRKQFRVVSTTSYWHIRILPNFLHPTLPFYHFRSCNISYSAHGVQHDYVTESVGNSVNNSTDISNGQSQWPRGLRVKTHTQRSGVASSLWFNSWIQIDRFVSTNWITSCWPLRCVSLPLGVGLWPLACWNWGFESRRWDGCLSRDSVVCCERPITRPGESYRVWVCHCVW
jgi:hypothetical protein